MRDPDGYYIEFCNCESLERFLHVKMAEDSKKYNFSTTKSVLTVGKKLKMRANDSKLFIKQISNESLRKVIFEFLLHLQLLSEIFNSFFKTSWKPSFKVRFLKSVLSKTVSHRNFANICPFI